MNMGSFAVKHSIKFIYMVQTREMHLRKTRSEYNPIHVNQIFRERRKYSNYFFMQFLPWVSVMWSNQQTDTQSKNCRKNLLLYFHHCPNIWETRTALKLCEISTLKVQIIDLHPQIQINPGYPITS